MAGQDFETACKKAARSQLAHHQKQNRIFWQYGYFTILIVTAVIGISPVAYFRNKKWL